MCNDIGADALLIPIRILKILITNTVLIYTLIATTHLLNKPPSKSLFLSFFFSPPGWRARRISLVCPPPSSSSNADADPISLALLPPAHETPDERVARLRDEAEAKERSNLIDTQLQAEREASVKAKKRGDIKILLLGESNPGEWPREFLRPLTLVINFVVLYERGNFTKIPRILQGNR